MEKVVIFVRLKQNKTNHHNAFDLFSQPILPRTYEFGVHFNSVAP